MISFTIRNQSKKIKINRRIIKMAYFKTAILQRITINGNWILDVLHNISSRWFLTKTFGRGHAEQLTTCHRKTKSGRHESVTQFTTAAKKRLVSSWAWQGNYTLPVHNRAHGAQRWFPSDTRTKNASSEIQCTVRDFKSALCNGKDFFLLIKNWNFVR